MVVRCMLSHLREVVEAVRKILQFVSMPKTLGLRCALVLLTNSDISLHKNTHIRHTCLFNILTRVGARASHGSKIKD